MLIYNLDDDKLQEIYFQLSQINPSLPVPQVSETTTLVDTVKEGAAKLSDQGKKIYIFGFCCMLTYKIKLTQLPVKTNLLSTLAPFSPHYAHLPRHP